MLTRSVWAMKAPELNIKIIIIKKDLLKERVL